jgi:hypothetical protein
MLIRIVFKPVYQFIVNLTKGDATRLVVSKLLTYPIIAFSTLYAFKIVRQEFQLDLFNSFVLLWTSIGFVGLFEYAFGIYLTNHILILGFDRTFRQKVKKICIILIAPPVLVIILGISIVFKIGKYEIFNGIAFRGMSIGQLLICCPLAIIFLTLYNLTTRISNGVSSFVYPQITLAIGNLIVVCGLRLVSSYQIGILVYLDILASAYLISACLQLATKHLRVQIRKFAPRKVNDSSHYNFFGNNYSLIVLFISGLVTFLNLYPRWGFSKFASQTELSWYLIVSVVLGIFASLSSTLSPLLWNRGINRARNVTSNFPRFEYRYALIGNLILFFPFMFTYIWLTHFYDLSIGSLDVFLLGLVGFLCLSVQNLHLIASNYLNERSELLLQLKLLVVQSLTFVWIVNWLSIDSALSLLICQLGISLFLSFIPTFFVFRKISNG